MTQAIVGKWGKNLAVRLPLEIAKAAHLTDGARVEMEARDGEIVIRPITQHLTIEDMFRGKDAAEWRELYAGAYDWGSDLGRESVETGLPEE
jgi:antitoxin MazE